MRNPLIIIPAVAALVGAAVGAQALSSPRWVELGASADRYQLVMEYRGEAFVIDHAMTRTDCFEAMPYSDPLKGLSFTCEMEG